MPGQALRVRPLAQVARPDEDDVARAYRIPGRLRFTSIVLPAALPQIFAGLRVGLQTSLLLMVVSELVASTGGIGFVIL